MKVFIDSENEWYPVYTISIEPYLDGDPEIDLSDNDWADYQRVRRQFWAWQERLANAYDPRATIAIFDDSPGEDE